MKTPPEIEINTAAPKRRRKASESKSTPVGVMLPTFELTSDELAWAARFFTAKRRLEASLKDGLAKEGLKVALAMMESVADNYTRRNAPALHLVSGGIK